MFLSHPLFVASFSRPSAGLMLFRATDEKLAKPSGKQPIPIENHNFIAGKTHELSTGPWLPVHYVDITVIGILVGC